MSNGVTATATSGQNKIKTILKSALLSFVFSLVFVLVFALIVKLTNIGEGAIGIVNQAIKIVSVFLGVLFSVKERGGWFLNGLCGGVLYAVIAFFVFSFVGGQFNWSNLFIDIGVSGAVGILAALLAAGKK